MPFSQKPGFTENILSLLQSAVEEVVEFLGDLSLSSGDFQRKYKRMLAGQGPRRFRMDWAELYRGRKAYLKTLSRLKGQGLIRRQGSDTTLKWVITKEGSDHAQKIAERRRNHNSLANAHFTPNIRKETIIVSFDIPEREKGKRRWLRAALRSLEFTLLQKSVWIGTGGVPKEFIAALRERDLLSRVHIVGVTKSGTLEHLA